jgi:hypothetical protein
MVVRRWLHRLVVGVLILGLSAASLLESSPSAVQTAYAAGSTSPFLNVWSGTITVHDVDQWEAKICNDCGQIVVDYAVTAYGDERVTWSGSAQGNYHDAANDTNRQNGVHCWGIQSTSSGSGSGSDVAPTGLPPIGVSSDPDPSGNLLWHGGTTVGSFQLTEHTAWLGTDCPDDSTHVDRFALSAQFSEIAPAAIQHLSQSQTSNDCQVVGSGPNDICTETLTWDLTLVPASPSCGVTSESLDGATAGIARSAAGRSAATDVRAAAAPARRRPLFQRLEMFLASLASAVKLKLQQSEAILNGVGDGFVLFGSVALVYGQGQCVIPSYGIGIGFWAAAEGLNIVVGPPPAQADRIDAPAPGRPGQGSAAAGSRGASDVRRQVADYQQIVQPVTPTLPGQPIVPGGAVTQQIAVVGNALLSDLAQIIGLNAAIQESLVRADDAKAAGDAAWETRQMDAAKAFTSQELPLLQAVPGLLTSLRTATAATGYSSYIVANEISGFQQGVRDAGGLPSIVTDALTQIGFDADDQADVQAAMLNVLPDEVAPLGGAKLPDLLTADSLVQSFQDIASGLTVVAKPRPNTGVAVTPNTSLHQLTVNITARDANCTTNNQLQSITFTRVDNATVSVPGAGTISAPSAAPVPISGQPSSIPLTIQRLSAGQATMVAMVVHDGCGDWRTFAGGGPNAF